LRLGTVGPGAFLFLGEGERHGGEEAEGQPKSKAARFVPERAGQSGRYKANGGRTGGKSRFFLTADAGTLQEEIPLADGADLRCSHGLINDV
jgi:hypothetical protein